MKTKEEILKAAKDQVCEYHFGQHFKWDELEDHVKAKLLDEVASHLSERVKELTERWQNQCTTISEFQKGLSEDLNIHPAPAFYSDAKKYIIAILARIKELESESAEDDHVILILQEQCKIKDDRIKELESQQQPVKEDEVFLMHLVDVVACFTAEQNMFYATNVRKELIAKARERFSSPPNQNVKE